MTWSYFKDPKDSSRQCLDLVCTCSQAVGYNITMQKSVNNEWTYQERDQEKNSHLQFFKKEIRTNLPRKWDLSNINFMTLKMLKKRTRRWQTFPCLQIGKINIMKMAIFLQIIYMFSLLSIKTPVSFFIKVEKAMQNSYGGAKDPMYKVILSRNSSAGSTMKPDRKWYCRAMVTKECGDWRRDSRGDQGVGTGAEIAVETTGMEPRNKLTQLRHLFCFT